MAGVVDLAQGLRVLMRWAWLVALMTVLGAAVGAAYAASQPEMWQSTASVYVQPRAEEVSLAVESADGQADPNLNRLLIPSIDVRTLAYLSDGSVVEQQVREQLGGRLPAYLREPGALAQRVSARAISGRPDVVTISTTLGNAGLSREVANAWATETADYANRLNAAGFSPPADAQINRATVANLALRPVRANPGGLLSALVGSLAGFLLGVLAAFALQFARGTQGFVRTGPVNTPG